MKLQKCQYRTFNDLLDSFDIPLDRVRLVRQLDPRMIGIHKSLYALWVHKPEQYRKYETIIRKFHQTDHQYAIGDYTASFVVDPRENFIFTGLSKVICKFVNVEPLTLNDFMGAEYFVEPPHQRCTVHVYELRLDERLEEYEGRLLIAWGDGRQWFQHAIRQNKDILGLRD